MDTSQPTSLGGSIILDNVAFSGITTANIQDSSGTVLAANVSPVRQWFQGNSYSGMGYDVLHACQSSMVFPKELEFALTTVAPSLLLPPKRLHF